MNRRIPWNWSFLLTAFLAAAPLNAAEPTTQPAADSPAAAAATANLPSADQIMDKFIDATGGRANYEKVTSRVILGKIGIPAANISGTMETYEVAGKVYANIEIAGVGKIERGYDGKTAWEITAATGPRIIDGPEKDEMVREAQFDTDTNWKKYYTAAVTGTDTLNGELCYKVAFTKPDKTVETRYFSKDSGLLLKSQGPEVSQQGQIDVSATLSDYKDFGGLKTPTKVQQEAGGQTLLLTTDSVEDNVPIPPEKFALPDDIKQLATSKPG